MAKYRALVDIPPSVKAGDIVEVNDELIPEFKAKLTPISEQPAPDLDSDSDSDSDPKTGVVNPSRTDLKARAAQLGLDYAPNITTQKLLELVESAEAAKTDEQDADESKDSDD